MENALDIYLKPILQQIEAGEIGEAGRALQMLDEKFNIGIGKDLSNYIGQFNTNERDFKKNLIDIASYKMYRSRAADSMIEKIDEIPRKTERNGAINQLRSLTLSDPTDGVRLEKIMGGASNLLKINWLEKAARAAKAVCRVVRTDGEVGTGWLIEGGYLITNHHVLPDKSMVEIAEAQFNFEIDSAGNARDLVSYKFTTADFLTDNALDYTRVKVLDRADQPIAQWGFLEIDGEMVPVKTEPVTIIQHPKGEDKQIALNANEVLGQTGIYLFYSTDTEGGSSGSPVFNKNLKVVALHNAGGNYDFDKSGIPKAANRGTLFRFINEFLKKNKSLNPPANTSGNESFKLQTPPISTVKTTQQTDNQVVTKPAPAQSGVPKLVFLYDLADLAHADSIGRQLNILKRAGKLSIYYQHKDVVGEVIESAKNAISEATFVVAIVTPNLFSDAVFELIDEAKRLQKTIIPVLVQSFSLSDTGLEGLRALPSNGQFVFPFWSNADAAWLDVSQNLRVALGLK